MKGLGADSGASVNAGNGSDRASFEGRARPDAQCNHGSCRRSVKSTLGSFHTILKQLKSLEADFGSRSQRRGRTD